MTVGPSPRGVTPLDDVRASPDLGIDTPSEGCRVVGGALRRPARQTPVNGKAGPPPLCEDRGSRSGGVHPPSARTVGLAPAGSTPPLRGPRVSLREGSTPLQWHRGSRHRHVDAPREGARVSLRGGPPP